MTSQRSSVRGVGAALHLFSVRPGHVHSVPCLLVDNDVELYGSTFTHVSLNLVRVFPGNRSLVHENVLAGVVANDEAFLDVESFYDPYHSLICNFFSSSRNSVCCFFSTSTCVLNLVFSIFTLVIWLM